MPSLPGIDKEKKEDIKCSCLFLEKNSPSAFERKGIFLLPAKDAWN